LLETVQQKELGAPIVHVRRKATVELYRNPNGDPSRLFEMGVPVQEIACPYSVNVLQKIPLPPNRDVAKASYLQDIYAMVLNETADEITDAAASWVRTATEDKSADPEAVKTVIKKRYGDKVVLWSSNGRSNDAAMAAGYEIVNSRTLSKTEREVFAGVGIQSASEAFPRGGDGPPKKYYDEDRLTKGMKLVRQYAKQVHQALIGKDVDVKFYCNIHVRDAAAYGDLGLEFNIGTLGKAWFDDHCTYVGGHSNYYSFSERVHGLILHEFAHTRGIGHEPEYYRRLEELAGKAVALALSSPSVFRVQGPVPGGLIS
jgi:hypothetical protein